MGTLIVEILDRFGKLKERHRIESFPCKVGRDYSNNIIIDDLYISPSHIIIDQEDGLFSLQDTDSMNGVFSLNPFKKQQSINIQDNSRIRIGHTDIRFRFVDHKIKETIQERDKPSQISMLLSNGFILPVVWLIFSLAYMLNNYLEETSLVTFQKLFSETFPLLLFMILWALVWSVVSKIVTHRFYFSFHAIWITCLTLISTIMDNFANYFEFGFSLESSSYILGLIFSLAITSVLLYGHLHYSTTLSYKKSRFASVITAIIIISIVEILSLLNTPEFSNTPKYSSIIKPSAFILSRQDSIDDFFADAKYLKTEIDTTLERQAKDNK